MSTWAIVPVKPLVRSKSRLNEVLTNRQREALSSHFLRRTVATLNDIPEISRVLVVSRDPQALAIARSVGAKTLQETGLPELNDSLQRATQVVLAWNASSIIVLPIDLPMLTADDVIDVLQLGRQYPSVIAIAPDERGTGTNALYLKPPGLLRYHYGVNSFLKHRSAAEQKGLPVEVIHNLNLSLDVDTPDDLEQFKQRYRGASKLLAV